MATLKAFMREHHGEFLHTIQASERSGIWAPMTRIAHAFSTYVTLGTSRRDYAGMHVLSTLEDRVIVCNDVSMNTVCVYFTTEASYRDVLEALHAAGYDLPHPMFPGLTHRKLERVLDGE